MEAFDIMDKKFDKGFNGYKMEDVDQFLQEVSTEFSKLKKQNQDLEKKMEVLADKIKEYRSDEDAIKEALLGAQKQSSAVQAAAKEKSENMIAEAQEKADKMIKDAEETVKQKDEFAKKLVEDANTEKTRIIAECERKSAEIKAEMEAEIRKLESIIAKTKEESNAYLSRLMNSYNDHIAIIKAIPEKCENEFVRAAQDSLVLPVEQEKPEVVNVDDAAKDKSGKKKPEKVVFEKTAEIASEPAFEEDDDEAEDADAEEYTDEKPILEKKKGKSKFEKLQFGNNNKNKE